MNRETSAERRIAPRVEARLPLQLTEPDLRLVVTTESIDLSRSGIACRTAEYLAPLSKVAVTVILPPFGSLSRASRSLRAEGVVVRCESVAKPDAGDSEEKEYDLACCFTALEPDARNLLDAFVAWRLLRSVRIDDPRASHHGRAPAAGGSARGHGPPRGRHGAKPRTGGRPGGPRPGGGSYRGARGTRPGGEGGRPAQGHAAGRGGPHPRGERSGRPPRGAGGDHAPGRGSDTGHRPASGGPRGERPPRGSPRGDGRPAEHRSGDRDRGRGPSRNPRSGGWRDKRGPEDRRPREAREGDSRPRPENAGPERHERTEEKPRDEKRPTWGRRPARRTGPHPKGTDPEARGR